MLVTGLLGVGTATWVTADQVSVHSVNIVYAVDVAGGEVRPELNGTSDLASWIPAMGLASTRHTEMVEQGLTWLAATA